MLTFLSVVIASLSIVQAAPTEATVTAQYRRITETSPAPLKSLDIEQVRTLYHAVANHPVATLKDDALFNKYDPDKIIGDRYGRAMAAHLIARRMGLAENKIAKLFMIGDLRSGAKPELRFHVTTLVRGPRNAWHAIDPVMGAPLLYPDWLSAVRKTWDRRSKAIAYLTPASAVLPDLSIVPAPKETGEHIIELSFDPDRPGFTAAEAGSEPFYRVQDWAANVFFSTAGEADAFRFLDIQVNSEKIGYHGYFVDLLNSIENADLAKIQSWATTVPGPRESNPRAAGGTNSANMRSDGGWTVGILPRIRELQSRGISTGLLLHEADKGTIGRSGQ